MPISVLHFKTQIKTETDFVQKNIVKVTISITMPPLARGCLFFRNDRKRIDLQRIPQVWLFALRILFQKQFKQKETP